MACNTTCISRGFERHGNKNFNDVFKGSQVAFVLQEKSKLSRISEAEWHQVNSGVDKTFIGKEKLNKNTQKDNVISELISENHKKRRRERQGNRGAMKLLCLFGAGVFQLSQWTP